MKKKSFQTQHLNFLYKITAHYENNTPFDTTYLNFDQTFDSAPDNKLIIVLKI